MNLFFLQEYFKKDDPVQGMILLIGLGVILVAVFVSNIIRHGMGGGRPSSGGGGGGGGGSRHLSAFALHRAARSYGLNRDQTKLLEYVFRGNGVTDPFRAMENPQALDKHFRRTYREIENGSGSEEDVQQKLSLLFSVRNTIDLYNNTKPDSSGQRLSSGMQAVLTVNHESYPVKVISSKEDSVMVECPRSAAGTQVHFPKGTRVTLAFFTKTSKGFSFAGQVLGTGDTSFGPALQLSRSGQAKAMTARRFRRTQAVLSCNYYLVRLETQYKKPPKMVVEQRRMSGDVSDISIGGCAIKTKTSVPPGSRLKIELDYDPGAPIAVLGQVLRINRSGISSTIMHVKFLKVPRKAMNVINALVFEYGN